MHVLFAALQSLFSLWMLIDAVRNQHPVYWRLVVLIPFGEWAYFFAIYLPHNGIHPLSDLKKLGRSVVRIPIDVGEAESVAQETPSPENNLRLAQAYLEDGQHGRAVDLYDAYVHRHPLEIEPRFRLAGGLLLLERTDEALPHLERIVELDRTWHEFEATFELARAYNMLDRPADAEALLTRIAKGSQRLAPTIELAAHLASVGDKTAATIELKRALKTYERSPEFIRNQDYYQAKRARKLLKTF